MGSVHDLVHKCVSTLARIVFAWHWSRTLGVFSMDGGCSWTSCHSEKKKKICSAHPSLSPFPYESQRRRTTTTHTQRERKTTTTTTTTFLCVTSCEMDPSWQPRTGAAQRRKGRRLRAAWRHEQQSIAQAVAVATHHSALRRQKTATAEATYDALRSQTTSVAGDTEFFSLYEEELGGTRPDRL